MSHNYVLSSQNWKIHSWAGVIFFQIIILSTKNPMLSSKLNVLSHNSIPSCQMWKIHSWAGVIFPDNCFEYHQSMLSSKLNIRTQNSVLSCQMWKLPSQTGIAFMRQSFWVQTTLCYLQNWMFCPITLFQVVRFEKSLHKQGLFLQKLFCYLQNWMFCPITPFQVVRHENCIHKQGSFFPDYHFEYQQPYVIFKIECFVP